MAMAIRGFFASQTFSARRCAQSGRILIKQEGLRTQSLLF